MHYNVEVTDYETSIQNTLKVTDVPYSELIQNSERKKTEN